MKKIAVIGANEPLECFYKQAKALGYSIVGIAPEEGACCKKYCDAFYPINFKEKDKVLEACKTEMVDGITSFSLESALPTLIYVAQNLGLVSNSFECLKRLENKFTMREYLERAGIANPQYEIITDKEELSKINVPLPCIVKPVDSGGSQGVTLVTKTEELPDAFDRAKSYARCGRVIIEEFIDGREFSVEYLSHKGKHYNIQITDKVTSQAPYFVELEHHQPADINERLRNRIKELVEKSLTALNVTDSPSHTEIKLNSKGELYIIEIGARLGGDHITSDLARLSTEYDMVKGALELATGEFKEPKIQNLHHSGIFFYSALTPEISHLIDHCMDYPFIVEVHRNYEVKDYCKRNGDRNGYAIYQSDKRINKKEICR